MDCMQGACGKIILTADPGIVIKKIHRRRGPHTRTSSHRAPEQCRLQSWAHSICTKENGFSTLYVPRAWDPQPHQYNMEFIHTDKPVDHKEISVELQLFYNLAKAEGIFPCDYELYRQPNGSVALIDFDKFAIWREDGSVQFPWGLVLSDPQLPI